MNSAKKSSRGTSNQVWCHMSVIPALWRLRHKDIKVKPSMDYTVSSMQDKHFVSIPERTRSPQAEHCGFLLSQSFSAS